MPRSRGKRKVAGDAEISADPIHSEIVGIGALLMQTQQTHRPSTNTSALLQFFHKLQTSGSEVSTSALGSA
jgi:hypothetical protein